MTMVTRPGRPAIGPWNPSRVVETAEIRTMTREDYLTRERQIIDRYTDR